jgi:hypothetical protein
METMGNNAGNIILDTRLLSDALIELNIARKNIAVYPKGHPSVDQSLKKVFDLLQQLFLIRNEIAFSIAKDTIVIDNFSLDARNVAFREFALYLNSLDIIAVTLRNGLTEEELYQFNRLLSEASLRDSPEVFQKKIKEHLSHISVSFIDYNAFSIRQGASDSEGTGKQLWEQYIHGLLNGTLNVETAMDVIHDMPPETLAQLVTRGATELPGQEAYERVTKSYIRWSSERALTGKELKKVIDFINRLSPELKRGFLSSAVKTLSEGMDDKTNVLKDISADRIVELLALINEQRVIIPEQFRLLLEKLSLPDKESGFAGKGLGIDELFLMPEAMSLAGSSESTDVRNAEYQSEIRQLMNLDASSLFRNEVDELDRECSDEFLDIYFCRILLELIASDIISAEEYEFYLNILKGQARQFVDMGQYAEVLRIIRVFEDNAAAGKFFDITSAAIKHFNSMEFISNVVESFRTIGRLLREESLQICDYYEERMLPYLMDVLIDEESPTGRRFFISLITHFGKKAVPEAVKRLDDKRWFVTRNMLYILSEFGGGEVLEYVKPYTRHENQKVRLDAIRLLVKAGDAYGIQVLRDYLKSESDAIVEQGASIAGALRVKEVIPDLLQMLRKKVRGSADIYSRIPLLKALGQIGDSRGLEIVREMLSLKSILSRGALEKMKEEIYKSLQNYPQAEISDLIEEGLKSKNTIIREESIRLKRPRAG